MLASDSSTQARPSTPWLSAMIESSAELATKVDSLDAMDLITPSFAADWSIADVLSHLGSGAEICSELVRRGLAGDERGPQRDELMPIWERWNALGPTEQRDAWRRADRTHLELLDGITAEQEAQLSVPYFAGPMTLTTYLGYRLSEHALHGWDVAVALDPSATVGQVELVWQRIDMIAARFHDDEVRQRLAPREIMLRHSDAEDQLVIDDEVHVITSADTKASEIASATTDVFTRLIYGRLRAGDPLELTGATTRSDLSRLFGGF